MTESIPRGGTRGVHHVRWTLLQNVPCHAYCGRPDSSAGWHGDDFYTEGEPGALDEADEMVLASFKAKVLPRLGPGASTEVTILRRILRWSEEGVHIAPDAKHVANLTSLLEVKGAKPSPTPSSRATGRWQRDVLELFDSCRGTGIALYLGPDRFDLQFAKKEIGQDMQTPSKLSMLRLRRFVRYLLGAADVRPFFAYQDEPNTVLVWTDGDWSGHAVTCKSTSSKYLLLHQSNKTKDVREPRQLFNQTCENKLQPRTPIRI